MVLVRIKGLFRKTHPPAGYKFAGKASKRVKPAFRPLPEAEIELRCPYCGLQLAEKPVRRQRCSGCGQYMYIRSMPSGELERLVTRQQALQIKKQWQDFHREAGYPQPP